jgi:hypothetical protein
MRAGRRLGDQASYRVLETWTLPGAWANPFSTGVGVPPEAAVGVNAVLENRKMNGAFCERQRFAPVPSRSSVMPYAPRITTPGSSGTRDLCEVADWLQRCRVQTVAMESTGVYWIPLYQILETRGFQVFLVNAQHVKNVPGRKSDVSDCQ